MGKCSLNTQKVRERQFSVSLPSGVAAKIYARDDIDKNGKQTAILRMEGIGGKSLTAAEEQEIREFVTNKIDEFRSNTRGLFENFYLARNEMKFSTSWFRNVETSMGHILSAQKLLDLERRPVKPESLRAQKIIASAIIRLCREGILALRKKKNVDGLGNQVVQLTARLLSEPDRIRGKAQVRSAQKGGKNKGLNSEIERRNWQREAENTWRRWPNRSVRSVAAHIAHITHIDKHRAETIRRVIKKPQPISSP